MISRIVRFVAENKEFLSYFAGSIIFLIFFASIVF